MEKSQERCRLRLYEIYAWGGPLLIAGTAAILDLVPKSPNSTFLTPKFCINEVWFGGKYLNNTFFIFNLFKSVRKILIGKIVQLIII